MEQKSKKQKQMARVKCKTAGYTDPKLRCSIMQKVYKSTKGGRSGQWSARKAQLVNRMYVKAGGGFLGNGTKSQRALRRWTRQKWRTKSGDPSLVTGERYLPSEAIMHLSASQYRRTSMKKKRDTYIGQQYSKQPKDVSKLTRRYRQRRPDIDFDVKGKTATKQDIDGSEIPILLWFYAKWCPHCHNFLPEYNKLVDMFENRGISIMSADVDVSRDLVSRFNVRYMPTIYYYYRDELVEYAQKPLKSDAIAVWLDKRLGNISD